MLDSVQGVEGGLKFDPTTGGFVAAGSIIQEFDNRNSFLFPDNQPFRNTEPITQDVVTAPPAPCTDGDDSRVKVEDDECCVGSGEVLKKSSILVVDCGEDSKSVAKNCGSCQQVGHSSRPCAGFENAPTGSCFAKGDEKWGLNRDGMIFLNSDSHLLSQSSSSLVAVDAMDAKMEVDDTIVEHNQPTCSSMTDSSNGSGSMMHGSTSSSPSFEKRKNSKFQTGCGDSGSKITVKATYKDDTIRFKFEPSAGCFQLYEEVSKRFKLQNGTFQLKYLDDEDEWVMLVSDSDLQECLEILDYVGTRNVKFLVRDMPFAMGSSGSSNCFLAGSS